MIHDDRYSRAHRHGSLWQTAAVAVASAAVTAVALLWWSGRIGSGDSRMARLVDRAARSNRPIESRISGGFSWTPLATAERSAAPRNVRLALNAVVGEIVENAQFDGTEASRHESAIAYMAAGNLKDASAILEKLATDAAHAAVWNDVAAVRYAIAQREEDGAKLVAALGAADTALRSDPKYVEALFNRALIVERLGLREQAREAWDAYLRADPSSDWSTEARAYVRKLADVSRFQDELERNYEALAANNAVAQAFARSFPQEARSWGETEILGRWAAAERAGSVADAAKHLRIASAFGTALSAERGDAMLRSLVVSIERSDASERAALVAAHEAFRAAQQAYRRNEPANAERIMVEAVAAFERGRSPGAFLARYFAANLAYARGRIDESTEALTRVLATVPVEFVACRAQILWQLGLAHMARARWDDTIHTLRESALLFERLNERRNAANIREILGNAYARVGNPAEASKQRMLALSEIGQRSSARLLTMLTSLGQTAALSGDRRAATALFRLAVEVADRIDDPFVESSTLLMRARVHVRNEDRVAAQADLQQAQAALERITDDGYRALITASTMHVKALLTSDPREAAEHLTSTIEFNAVQGRRARLPELFLDRGRARLASGDIEGAAADFEAGIAELESRRETIADAQERVGMFDEVEALFDEAIALALRRNDEERAFLYSERSRARALLDALGVRWPAVDRAAIPEDAVVLEYFVNADGVSIFSVDREGVRATVSHIDRATLAGEASAVVSAAKPIAARSASDRRCAVVPAPDRARGRGARGETHDRRRP